MKSTRQTKREAKELVRLCCVNGLLDESRVRQVVDTLVDAKRRGYMALLSDFQRLVRLKSAEHTAEVASAEPLADDLRSRLSGHLERLYGPGLKVRFITSSELIGGMRVIVGSDVYDGSVRYRLALLNRHFLSGGIDTYNQGGT